MLKFWKKLVIHGKSHCLIRGNNRVLHLTAQRSKWVFNTFKMWLSYNLRGNFMRGKSYIAIFGFVSNNIGNFAFQWIYDNRQLITQTAQSCTHIEQILIYNFAGEDPRLPLNFIFLLKRGSVFCLEEIPFVEFWIIPSSRPADRLRPPRGNFSTRGSIAKLTTWLCVPLDKNFQVLQGSRKYLKENKLITIGGRLINHLISTWIVDGENGIMLAGIAFTRVANLNL